MAHARFAALLLALIVIARGPGHSAGAEASGIPNDRGAVLHALNRLTFGPRSGDVERVRSEELGRWIDRQLNPGRIDDSALGRRLPEATGAAVRFESPKEARRAARAAIEDLAAAKLLRAAYTERQLEEVLADFWFNHFNVFAGKGRVAVYLPAYEREAIRPHVLGRFRDLLGATARHPAMLFYLDNWLSVDPDAAAGRRRGLNENYARELLELHTLGVDGGYTQQDVVEVARAFTGWTIAPAEGMRRRTGRSDGGQFRFVRALHDDGEKKVLGQTIGSGGGIDDGERVLDIVASQSIDRAAHRD
jgi:uncharacterized protein (DUF1800 family)